ncbi:calcium-binding protein [Pararhizobium arenae]|uniref:calcium-binding protein n=1 Tax=Pararhizobium arenae TaxID=1856850 RepID=UPI00094B62C8|nr:hypothetical protein [Pararhizobium arenae]
MSLFGNVTNIGGQLQSVEAVGNGLRFTILNDLGELITVTQLAPVDYSATTVKLLGGGMTQTFFYDEDKVPHLVITGDDAANTYINFIANGRTAEEHLASREDVYANGLLFEYPVEIHMYGGDDTVIAGVFSEEIFGGSGNDTIRGNLGDDIVRGDDGNDILYGDGFDNKISHDKLYGGKGNDKLYGEYGNDVLAGDSGNDYINGSAGNDSLSGGSGDDDLVGGSGNDALNGGSGWDSLNGGSGDDIFKFTLVGGSHYDIIEDFTAADDNISLSKAAFTAITGTSTLSSGQFYKSTSGVAHDASDRIIYETDTGELYYDFDGNGSGGAQLVAILDANLSITETSFLLSA